MAQLPVKHGGGHHKGDAEAQRDQIEGPHIGRSDLQQKIGGAPDHGDAGQQQVGFFL